MSGGIYHNLFYVGDFYYPVEPDHIQQIKDQAQASPEAFLRLITEKLGYNAYLKKAIEKVIEKATDTQALAKTLQAELQSL